MVDCGSLHVVSGACIIPRDACMGYRQARPSRLLTAGMTIERAGILAGVAMTLIVVVAWMMDFPYLLLLPLAGLMAWWAVSKLDLYLGCILLLVPVGQFE